MHLNSRPAYAVVSRRRTEYALARDLRAEVCVLACYVGRASAELASTYLLLSRRRY